MKRFGVRQAAGGRAGLGADTQRPHQLVALDQELTALSWS